MGTIVKLINTFLYLLFFLIFLFTIYKIDKREYILRSQTKILFPRNSFTKITIQDSFLTQKQVDVKLILESKWY